MLGTVLSVFMFCFPQLSNNPMTHIYHNLAFQKRKLRLRKLNLVALNQSTGTKLFSIICLMVAKDQKVYSH